MTEAKLWRNPCPFSFRLNYLAMRYNTPCYDWVHKTVGLSRIEYVVIYSLALCEGGLATDIAMSSGFPKNSLSRAMAKLEKSGLIMRKTDDQDKRNQPLHLTEEGWELFNKTLHVFEKREQELLDGLTEDEVKTLSNLMAKIVLNTANLADDISSEITRPDREQKNK
ncbi:MarR family winged helix-turn-helix transcriptional regulator [Sneathiella aquimaris]|uniref:MarR family winged helix-turn-helix transcriptional regulator n=1 Tax=Sneathiella aquimaris TaxID=2599305 RepID=UPI001C681587|nr:MarR family transcriptional regulator [Sneathiella aquimaris]